jgi:hypothetical protein
MGAMGMPTTQLELVAFLYAFKTLIISILSRATEISLPRDGILAIPASMPESGKVVHSQKGD